MFVLLVVMALAWPLSSLVAAGLLIWWLVLAADNGQRSPEPSRLLSRSGWMLSAAAAAAAVAVYGFGLSRTTSLLLTDPEARCAMRRPDLDGPQHSGGSESLWPLHDTTCGSEVVPAFVNPLVVVSVALCVTFTALTLWARVRERRGTSSRPLPGPRGGP